MGQVRDQPNQGLVQNGMEKAIIWGSYTLGSAMGLLRV